jgi:hypothetical protein
MADFEDPQSNPARIPKDWRSGGFFVDIGWPEVKKDPTKVVLLVHGASAGSRTFDQHEGGLRSYLTGKGWNVYTVDWRSSMLTAPTLLKNESHPEHYTLDGAALDLSAALEWVAKHAHTDEENIAVVGHCVGGGLVAQAIARGEVEEGKEKEESLRPFLPSTGPFKPKRVVLTTLALFWRVGVEGWFKGTDLVIDDVQSDSAAELSMSAGESKWPDPIEERFKLWLDSGLHHGCGIPFCQRICFMYGMPFRLDDVEYIHNQVALGQQFGAMPLSIYVHCLQNLRRGWLAPFNAPDSRARVLVDEAARQRFANKRITLITGNENQVWHRDCMDRMYEWLCNGEPLNGRPQSEDPLIVKHVLPKYGHQDLYWSTEAAKDVYPLILKGLRPLSEI